MESALSKPQSGSELKDAMLAASKVAILDMQNALRPPSSLVEKGSEMKAALNSQLKRRWSTVK
jgi:hypothetical protein